MADLSDVEDAITALVTDALYPDGVGSPSVLNTPCRIYRGWPNAAALNTDLAAGLVNVTVSPDTDPGKTTTRFNLSWHDTPAAPTLRAVVAGNTAQFAGTVEVGQLVGVKVDGKPYVYVPAAGDSPDLVAASLATAIRQVRPATSAGSVLTIPGSQSLLARVVMSGTNFTEIRRQQRDIRVIAWCPDPVTRDNAIRVVDTHLARHAFLSLPDASTARLLYKGTAVYDQAQNALLYRRDVLCTAEYPTIITDALPAMLFGTLHLNAAEFTA